METTTGRAHDGSARLRRWQRIAVAAIAVVAFGSAFAASAIDMSTPTGDVRSVVSRLSYDLGPAVLATIALFILRRMPGNRVAWLMLAAAAEIGLDAAVGAYATWGSTRHPYPPLAVASDLLSGVLWPVKFAFLLLLLQIFPDGRAVSARWRPVAIATVVAPCLIAFLSLFWPDPDPVYGLRMPFALSGSAAALAGPLFMGASSLMQIGSFLGTSGALVTRFRRARGVERQQLKWLAFASVALVAANVLAVVGALGAWSDALLGVVWYMVPVAFAVAILRYRLYDIDVLIRRTIVYGAVTAVLAGAYVAGITVLQALLAPFTSGSGVAVAASTLAVVALFQPVRRRIRTAVDRRFYRTTYDAERTLDAFAARLSDEIDLVALRGELLAAVVGTVRPASASVWLNRDARVRGDAP